MGKPTFEQCFDRLIGHEGGLSMDPHDPGNWTGGRPNSGLLKGTKYGIAASAYPNLDIPNLSLLDARRIYRADYWDRVHGDELPAVIAFQAFDAAVNHGTSRAIKWLQQASGANDDGEFGPKTALAIRTTPQLDLLARFNSVRLEFYTDLMTWDKFGKGWARRVAGNLAYGAQDAV